MSQGDNHEEYHETPPSEPGKEAPKKKRSFWGWLTGSADTPSADTPEALPAEPAPPAADEAAQASVAEDVRAAEAESAAEVPVPAAEETVPPAAEAAALEPAAPVTEAPAPVAPPQDIAAEAGAGLAPEDIQVPPAGQASEPVAPEPPAPELPTPEAPQEEEAGPATTSRLETSEARLEARPPSEPPLSIPAAPLVEPVLPPEPPEPAQPARAEAVAGLEPVQAPLNAPVLETMAGGVSATNEPGAELAALAGAEAEPVEEGAEPEPVAEAPAKKGFWARLASGLARTASNLGQGITDLVSKRKLDADTLEELEEVLIRADLGVETAMRIVEAVGKGRHNKMISPDEVKGLIAAEVEQILEPVAKPLVVDRLHKPFVVLMVGVNGSGKTTTIGKLAAQWRKEGRKVVLAAGDTFRAAAIEQLKVWGARTHTPVIAREPGADAAGVAFDALNEARAMGADILLIDTAGRLQNRTELMAELEKIVRVVKKLEPSAPHAVLLVLDATVGQNALSQVEAFTRIAGVTGLVMTKLDGTARGGILVAIAAKHKLPVHLIGVGEAAEDLQPFTARDFARAIAGLE